MRAVALAEPLTPEWFKLRRAGVSASEIAAVCGISPWESPFSLYWRKVHGWEREASDEAQTGQILEPAIGAWFAGQADPNENCVFAPGGLYAHPERSWQLATPDLLWGWRATCGPCDAGLPMTCTCDQLHLTSPLLAVIECKWVAYTWDGWGEPGSAEIPVHYRAQVLWQCDVLEVESWYLAALGPGGFRSYEGRRDEKDLAVMRRFARDFLDRIADGDPPPVDEHTATLHTLKTLHPSVTDDDTEVSVQLAEGYRRARALRARAEAAVDRYEARLREAIGDGRRAMCNHKLVASRSVYERKPYEVGPATIDRLNPGRATSYV